MALVEAVVVIYLRALYYPEGFSFPLKIITTKHFIFEIVREAATILMLISVGALIGKRFWEKFAYFLIFFGFWDIFYYIWLKIAIGWPLSLLDWDILFLIPSVWASPVLYPILVSAAMFAFAVAVLQRSARGRPLALKRTDWIGWAVASAVLVLSFCLGGTHVTETDYAAHFRPWLFAVGYGPGLVACVRPLMRPARGR